MIQCDCELFYAIVKLYVYGDIKSIDTEYRVSNRIFLCIVSVESGTYTSILANIQNSSKQFLPRVCSASRIYFRARDLLFLTVANAISSISTCRIIRPENYWKEAVPPERESIVE